MSTTLDKLKALNDKLDAKLTAKSRGELPLNEGAQTGQKTSKTRSKKAAEEAIPEANRPTREEVALILLAHLGVDSDDDPVRAENLERVADLYLKLGIIDKAPEVDQLFIYKAMNISGIGLKEEDFGQVRIGKYVQVIAITYEPDKNGKKKAKNISLGYFGKAETLDETHKNEIIEFVLRWRYEKAFQNLEHYRELLGRVQPSDRLF